MTKAELVAKVAEKVSAPKTHVKTIVDTFLEEIMATVKEGENVTLTGFGTFYVSKRGERMGRNPRTGEKLKIQSYKLPSFKSGKIFKELVNS